MNAFPLLLPHFRIQNETLIYIAKAFWKKKLPREQANILSLCNGRNSPSRLRRLASETDEILGDATKSGLIIWIQSNSPNKVRSAERWLVLSPHQDDAAISMGGTLLKNRSKVDIHILTLVTKSVFSVLPPLDRKLNATSRIRKKEDLVFAQFLGATIHEGKILEHLALVLRNSPKISDEELLQQIGLPPAESKIQEFEKVIRRHIRTLKPEMIWVPLAVGNHMEHLATCEGLFRILRKNIRLLSHVKIAFYEDLPYVYRDYPSLDERLRWVRKQHFTIKDKLVNIDREFEKKKVSISIYRSQPYMNFIEAVDRYARQRGKQNQPPLSGKYERIWLLNS